MIKQQTFELIDDLKATCKTYGLGNDGNEYKVITQVFLYKFLNDKFGYEIKCAKSPYAAKIKNADKWETAYEQLAENEREMLLLAISPDVPKLQPQHLISYLWNQQSRGDFDLIFDSTMTDIAEKNIDVFYTQTSNKTKIGLFEPLTIFVTDPTERAPFARALIDRLAKFSFEDAFAEHYDFFASIFEYLIKDYNTAGGGKYAEYYTPHAIATIMARLLVGDSPDLHSMECYDPSAGTGTLLMALAHQIGEDKCTIYSQDISQRSNKMLKLNLILNNLVASLDNAVQGDTLVSPYHKSDDGQSLKTFDFVVSNPPFNMDFSDTREKIAAMPVRFWAGVPKIADKDKSSMAIYTCFIQHVFNSLKKDGKAAIVVPTGFVTLKQKIELNIRKKLIDDNIVLGCVSMPSNVFANTNTNVSILFLDKSKNDEKVVLMDASKMGEDYQDNGIKKHRLTAAEIERIVSAFRNKEVIEDFSVVLSCNDIKGKEYSLSAGNYFDIKINYVDVTAEEFHHQMNEYKSFIISNAKEIENLTNQIVNQLDNLR